MPPYCSAVDMVVSPSAGMAEVLRRLGVHTPIEILPNGVELDRYRGKKDNQRAGFGFDTEDILLVYSGRLAPEKNLDFLLQAFVGTAEAVPEARLLIIGGGPEEERLRQAVSQTSVAERIHFTGMIPYDNLPLYLAMCDVFITASVTEVHPLSVIEAMATGLPTLGIHSVGVGDTIEDGVTGFLARNDTAAFTAKMTRLCLDQSLRKRMGTAASKTSEKYAIERTNKVMLAHYERLVFEAGKRKRGLRYRLHSLLERIRG
jgi:1,2-diacylglycerol 3-alpha-glucosyltransferase